MKPIFKNIFYGLIIGFLILFIIYSGINEQKENKSLEDSIQTTAIVIRTRQGGYKTSAGADFKYKIGEKVYNFNQTGGFYQYLNVGDTVLIEYAKNDNLIARVIDSKYMQKFHH